MPFLQKPHEKVFEKDFILPNKKWTQSAKNRLCPRKNVIRSLRKRKRIIQQ